MGHDNYPSGPSSGKRPHSGQEDADLALARALDAELNKEESKTSNNSHSSMKQLTSKVSSLTTQGQSTSKSNSTTKHMASKASPPTRDGLSSSKTFPKGKQPPLKSETAPAPALGGKSMFPDAIETALHDLQKFTEEIIQTKCHACQNPLMHDFKVSRWFQDWLNKNNSGRAFSICSARCSKTTCRAMTCIGCGKEPRMGRFTKTCNGLKLDWCCEDGRLFAFWVALCKYDETELQQQLDSAAKLAAHKSSNAARVPLASKGTGYATPNVGGWGLLAMDAQNPYSMAFGGGWSGGHIAHGPRMNHTLNFQQADEKTDPVISTILGLIIELLPIPADDGPKIRAPPTLRAMIQLSLLLDKVADMLRNDSLRNVTLRREVYYALLEFVHRLGKRRKTMYLVCDQRFLKKRSSGLQILSASESFDSKGKGKTGNSYEDLPLVIGSSKDDMVASVVGCMAKLALQAKELSEKASTNRLIAQEFDTETGKAMLEMASKINQLYTVLESSSHEKQESKHNKDNASLWDTYHEKHRVDWDPLVSQYLCAKIRHEANLITHSPKNRMRRIVSEQIEMTTGLPQYIFVKVDDAWPHIMKCLMVGPEDTPYEGGLFEFDILCTESYPFGSPGVQFLTTGRGTVWFNPNLYADGKVCLSLLGTWEGPPESKWQPQISTIQSILSSIHAFILTDNPYENEPGHDQASTHERSTNRDYTYQCQALTVRYAILDWLQRPEMRKGPWKDVVATYFKLRGDKVLATARKWAKSNHLIEGFPAYLRGGHAGGFSGIPPRNLFGSSGRENLVRELEVALGCGQPSFRA